ncbi:hypothetical protein LSH36_203g03012 [Paralvinella palmiformis]|uniref:Uncharacterized protein n=1 Tax=Paralvinella palmiformis TaxID=53620 RepID=A0AAD9JPH1_9ANNE|nr:hypothetical protein LSH36_203g03012 [Paralvinella palmiformis]
MDFTSGMKEDIRQIRSFLKPPQSVIIVVQAVLLLLEQDELTTSEWKKCQPLMNTTKQFNMLKKMESFDIGNVHLDVITRVRELLDMMSPEQLYSSSTEAYSLYDWPFRHVKDSIDVQTFDSERDINVTLYDDEMR